MAKVVEVTIGPLKGARRLRADGPIHVTNTGIRDDNEWVITNAESRQFVAQRAYTGSVNFKGVGIPAMARIQPQLTANALILSAEGMQDLAVPFLFPGAELTEVLIKNDVVSALSQGPEADEWVTEFLVHNLPPALQKKAAGMKFQLNRIVPDANRKSKSGKSLMCFHDGAPFTIHHLRSWQEIAGKCQDAQYEAVERGRFRTTIVVDGPEQPFSEFTWRRLRIGNVEFQMIDPSGRCVVINTNQDTGAYSPQGPLTILRDYRKHPDPKKSNEVVFASNLDHLGTGEFQSGDEVVILETWDPWAAQEAPTA